MKFQLGNYYYKPCRTEFQVYRLTEIVISENGEVVSTSAEPIKKFAYALEAKRYVYNRNGWDGTPVRKQFIIAVKKYESETHGTCERKIITPSENIEDAKRYIANRPLSGDPETYTYENYEK